MPPLGLLQRRDGGAQKSTLDDWATVEEGRGRERRYVCRRCALPITRVAWAIEVDGSHRHTFANPHGYVYHIACFLWAPACQRASEESDAFTWFDGYSWHVAVCGRCGSHLGWGFQSERHRFHGLIMEKLAEEG